MVVVALERLLGAPVAEAEAQLLGPSTPHQEYTPRQQRPWQRAQMERCLI